MTILTFDIEDWFHTHENRQYFSGHVWKELPSRVEVNTIRILDMLDKMNLKATFFILGWVAEYYPELVKSIHTAGHEIGSHSNWHHTATLLSPEDFQKDLVMCLSRLQDIIKEPVTTYRAPGFSLRLKDQWAFEILASNGITVDSSVQLSRNNQNPPLIIEAAGKQIMEFPLLKSAIGIPYSGGGYFRAMPECLHNYLFKSELSDDGKGSYRLLYFHPRDFDPDNPYSNLFTLHRNWLNGYNTGKNMDRLIKVLKVYDTCTLGVAVEHYIDNRHE